MCVGTGGVQKRCDVQIRLGLECGVHNCRVDVASDKGGRKTTTIPNGGMKGVSRFTTKLIHFCCCLLRGV